MNGRTNKWHSLAYPVILAVCALLLGAGKEAHAEVNASYLDPGSASYLFQMAIAGAFGALYAMRRVWCNWRTHEKNKSQH